MVKEHTQKGKEEKPLIQGKENIKDLSAKGFF